MNAFEICTLGVADVRVPEPFVGEMRQLPGLVARADVELHFQQCPCLRLAPAADNPLVLARPGPEVQALNFGEPLRGQLPEVAEHALGVSVFGVLEREPDGIAQ